MSTTFPFTNAGFLSLQIELYQLNDEQLATIAKQVYEHFEDWVNEQFELTEKQLLYLSQIDERAKNLLAFNTSFALANRLPISLAKDGESTGDDQGKIIWPQRTLTAKSGANLGFEASGSLTIHISYQN